MVYLVIPMQGPTWEKMRDLPGVTLIRHVGDLLLMGDHLQLLGTGLVVGEGLTDYTRIDPRKDADRMPIKY